MTRMGRAVLPVSEQILFALNWLWRHCINRAVKPYVPDFRQAFDHFCLHAGVCSRQHRFTSLACVRLHPNPAPSRSIVKAYSVKHCARCILEIQRVRLHPESGPSRAMVRA